MRPKSLVLLVFQVLLVVVLPRCASSGPQRYRSFFQGVELARSGDLEAAREAFSAACSQNSTAACHRTGRDVPPTAPVPILQGATSDSATELVVLVEAKQQFQFFLWDKTSDKLLEPLSTLPIDLPAGAGRLVQLRYDGMNPVSRYQFQVVGAAGELVDGRELRTLDLAKKHVAIAVASCMDNRMELQKQMWTELASHEPEVLFLIGDNVYSDIELPVNTPAPSEMVWRRYFETRRDLEIFRLRRLIPTFAVWDDHDYGQNDGDRTYPGRLESRKIFQAFFGSAEYPGIFDRGPGVASRFSGFGQRFFFLDDRSFRAPRGEKGGSHFGVDQESWLFTELFSGVPSWLISGDQFFGAYHPYESYEGRHADSFARFLRRLKGQTSPVLFLSGDRHLAEIMEIPVDVLGYRTFEITTSAIHATVYPDPWSATPNPRKMEGVASIQNYAILEADVGTSLNINAKIYGPDKRRLISRGLELRK